LLILLNALHVHHRALPDTVSLEILAKLAVLVDYYDCHEAIEVFARKWIDQMKDEIPNTYCRGLILWLCITEVFKTKDDFQGVTATVMKTAASPIRSLDLPIPNHIISKNIPLPTDKREKTHTSRQNE
jgi:hypothetical protein